MRIGRSIAAAIATHASLTTDIHGVGSDYLAKTGQSDGSLSNSEIPDAITRDIELAAHAALATVHHDPANQDVDKLDGFDVTDLIRVLAVSDFQANAASGTATNPHQINDNDTGTYTYFLALGQYAEIEFTHLFYISAFRHYGWGAHNQDGSYKIQYWTGAAWVDNTMGIPTRLSSWSTWTLLTTPIVTTKIRIVATSLDTDSDNNSVFEWEMCGLY